MIVIRMGDEQSAHPCQRNSQPGYRNRAGIVHVQKRVVIQQRRRVGANVAPAMLPGIGAIGAFTVQVGITFSGASAQKCNFHLALSSSIRQNCTDAR